MKLFEDGLKDMYWAENALTKAIPKMIKKATSSELIKSPFRFI
jgi:ferritin-like metal-binding protein YciE